jgi:hypothetical protein
MKPPELMVETPYDVRCPWQLRLGDETAKIHVDVATVLIRCGVGTSYDGVTTAKWSAGRSDSECPRLSLAGQSLIVEWGLHQEGAARMFDRVSPRLRRPQRTPNGYRAELKITKKAAAMLVQGLPPGLLQIEEGESDGACT